jgi:hypothetical protein
MSDISNKKDIWDRIATIATILVPAAIALAGHFVAQGLKQAEIISEERRAESSMKIAQANLINTMIKSLISDKTQERKLAVEAVLIALPPNQGPNLARIVMQSDDDGNVKSAAKDSLEQRRDTLISSLFSDNPRSRTSAAKDLVHGWPNDQEAVSKLINFATQNKDNDNGVYNTVVVLKDFSKRALEPHKKEVQGFIEEAKKKGPKTKEQAEGLSIRLGGEPKQ